MLKNTRRYHDSDCRFDKRGSQRQDYVGPLASGLNRRAFLKTSSAMALLAGLPACKPSAPPKSDASESETSDAAASTPRQAADSFLSATQKTTLQLVQLQLFPDDGNGPSATEINALAYLEWAMNDEQNIADGDPEFIRKGIGWLDDLANQTQGDVFSQLNSAQQDKVLRQIAQSRTGENWLSLLMYYLTEALLLDPVYGGNTHEIGWQWLEHQAGFPRPVEGKTYRDFDE